ncbi:hypothetical protein [Anaerotignum propionicum]|uniref:Uncharacterized protein n=1 Tax=Anaerotignum propionicum DSM 1682 TaxID=991789 RepID=A0A0X8VB07_ANAPI|nr:hypothetical protein [Anaerotignum propionicum]AMJ41714.1 hypothetical protein CPRO_21340 [Anaerotignum propionicum DSM 1682]SHE83070.1 hypothetical protein SAMN02745151_01912 [[Clostridium] propionicum DSM 1682] [Anaerotignum propionicum DSM 1682]
MDNKKMMELKRKILVTMENMKESEDYNGAKYPIIQPDDANGYNLEMIKTALEEMLVDRHITDGFTKTIIKVEEKLFDITRDGLQLAEHWSNDDRWKNAMEVCNYLGDFSTRTIHMVYDELERKDVLAYIDSTQK